MKRKITGIFCLLMALLLVFTACGSGDPALVGTWECNYEITELLSDYWQEQGIDLKTEEKLYVQLELVFTKDSCSMYCDAADTAALTEHYFDVVLAELVEMVYTAEAENGRSRAEADAYYAAMDTSIEALCETLLTKPRAMVEEFMAESEALERGVYRTENGELYMEANEADLRNATEHLHYSISGNALTLEFGDQILSFEKK